MKRSGKTLILAMLVFSLSVSALFSRKGKELEEMRRISELASQGKTDEAIAGYQEFINDHRRSSFLGEAWLSIGRLYVQKKDYNQALSALSQAIVVSKESSEREEASLLMAKIYFTQKKYLEAHDSLQGVFPGTKDPKNKTEMANVLFQSNRNLGRYKEAVYFLGQYSMVAEPKDAEKAQAVLPDLIPKMSDTEIEQALQVDGPDWIKSELTFALGRRYFEESRIDEAKSQLETLLRKHRESPRREEAASLLNLIDKLSRVESGRIGLILPLSGPYQNFGERALKGALLAAGIFKKKEGGSQIELRVANADSDPQAAIDAVKKMVTEDNIIALVGPITNLNASSVADLAQQMGLPMIALSPSRELKNRGNFVFRDCLTKQSQVSAILDWAIRDKKLKKFAILYPENKYGTEFADLFDKEVVARGGTIIKKVSYPSGETDFRDQVESLMKGKTWEFDALFIPDSWERVDLIVPHVLYFKIETQLLGASGWHSLKLFEQIRAQYVEKAVLVDLFAPELKAPAFEKYQFEYQQAFGENPSLIDIQAYEAVSLLIDLISNKGAASRKSLAGAIAEAGNWTGPLGPVTVSPDGEIAHSLTLFTIEKGAFKPIK